MLGAGSGGTEEPIRTVIASELLRKLEKARPSRLRSAVRRTSYGRPKA